MTLKTRVVALLAAVAISVGAYLALRGGEEEPTASSQRVHAFEIRGAAVMGGEGEVRVEAGDPLRITVAADASHQVHLHGYDRYASASPGAPALFALRADLEGVFELEVHETAGAPRIPIARVRVEP